MGYVFSVSTCLMGMIPKSGMAWRYGVTPATKGPRGRPKAEHTFSLSRGERRLDKEMLRAVACPLPAHNLQRRTSCSHSSS